MACFSPEDQLTADTQGSRPQTLAESESHEGCSNTTAGPTPHIQTQDVWVGPEICISHQLLGDADAASLGTAFGEPQPEALILCQDLDL